MSVLPHHTEEEGRSPVFFLICQDERTLTLVPRSLPVEPSSAHWLIMRQRVTRMFASSRYSLTRNSRLGLRTVNESLSSMSSPCFFPSRQIGGQMCYYIIIIIVVYIFLELQ